MSGQYLAQSLVGICESQPATAEGLALMLSRTEDLACRWSCSRTEDMLVRGYAEPVDLLVLDGGLGLGPVKEAIKAYRVFAPDVRILVWAGRFGTGVGKRLIQAGADGWIEKSAPTDILLLCFRTLLNGGVWPQRSARQKAAPIEGESRLTAREKQVLQLLLANRTTLEISKELGMAPGTAKLHCRWIYTKLGVSGRMGLISLASNGDGGGGGAQTGQEEDPRNRALISLAHSGQ